jgi:hypothetical protein
MDPHDGFRKPMHASAGGNNLGLDI